MNKKHIKFVLLSMLLAISNGVYAKLNTPIETLLTRYENGDMTTKAVLDLYAKEGNPHALITLGFIYEHGINTPKDINKALDYYQQACDLGGDYGCGNAWYFYQYGIGIDKNSKKAALFAEKINKNDIPLEIANSLSIELYDAKAEAEVNPYIRANFIENLSRWLSSGDEQTQLMFARMGFSKQDTLHLAKVWATENEKDARLNFQIGHLYNFGYSALDSNKKDFEALKWFQKAAELGEPNSQNIIAHLYEKGDWGIKQDPKKAIEWYQKAIASGDGNAQMNLAKIYYEGVFTEVDYKKSLSLFERAEDYNPTEAAKYLSKFYYNGQLVTTDCNKSADYYQKSHYGYSEELSRSKYIEICQSDKKMRDNFKNELPELVMRRISTFGGDYDALVKCELSFGVFSYKTIPVENLRVKVQIITEGSSDEKPFIQEQTVAFPPFGFNSLNKKENGERDYQKAQLVPIYDKRGCSSYKTKTEIVSATALINGKPIDLLEEGLISFRINK